MKYSFTLGGLIGFTLVFPSALLAGSDADTALRDALFSSLAVAMLFRWLRSSLLSQLTALVHERTRAAAATPADTTAPSVTTL